MFQRLQTPAVFVLVRGWGQFIVVSDTQNFSYSFHLPLVPAKLWEMFGLFILLHFERFSRKRCRPASAACVWRKNKEFLFDQGRVDLVSVSSLRITKHLPTWIFPSLCFWNTVVLFSLSCLPFSIHISKSFNKCSAALKVESGSNTVKTKAVVSQLTVGLLKR